MIRKIAIVILITCATLIAVVTINMYRYSRSYEAAAESLYGDSEVYAKSLKLVFPTYEYSLPYSEYATLQVEPLTFDTVLDNILNFKSAQVPYDVIPNEEKIRSFIEKQYTAPVDAYIVYTNIEGWHIVNQQEECSYDVEALSADAIMAIDTGSMEIDCTPYMIPAEVRADDLQAKLERVEWMNDFHITYENGIGIVAEDIVPYVVGDFSALYIGPDNFQSLFDDLRAYYETSGRSVQFTTSGGKTIDVKYVTYGKSFDEEATKEAFMQYISDKESVDGLQPVLTGYDSGLDTYVEISLQDQHVWHYVGGTLCCETDCVTGTKGKHDTPTGVYYISERISGKYLVGDNNEYKTWVNKWMRLTNSGVGLHDAYWRGSFGGNIYTYNGSHGCINLPPKYAATLFDEVRAGTPAVIY